MGKALNHLSDEASQVTNTTGVMTPVLEIDPEDGRVLHLLNHVPVGSGPGLPVYMKLYSDASGTQMPNDTQVQLMAKPSGESQYKPVSVIEDSFSAWRENSIADQRNEENVNAVKIELEGERVNIRDIDTLALAVNASAQIDWTDSEVYFEKTGVQASDR